MMSALTFGVLSFSSLLTIIDPIAAAPLFVALTDGADAARRRRTALKACAVSLGLLVVFAVCGALIFRLFGITIDAFRIAGGILFFAMAMPMLTGAEREAPADGEAAHGSDPSIVPLGMPIIAGPGAISTVMVLMGQSASTLEAISLIVAIVGVIAVTAAFLIVSPGIVRFIGKSGIHVVTQVMGLIMCVIGIQFIINGLRPVVIDILSSVR